MYLQLPTRGTLHIHRHHHPLHYYYNQWRSQAHATLEHNHHTTFLLHRQRDWHIPLWNCPQHAIPSLLHHLCLFRRILGEIGRLDFIPRRNRNPFLACAGKVVLVEQPLERDRSSGAQEEENSSKQEGLDHYGQTQCNVCMICYSISTLFPLEARRHDISRWKVNANFDICTAMLKMNILICHLG